MSILIKGMEMPKRCEECKLCIAMGLKSPPLCAITGSRVLGFANPRLGNCPLTEIVHCKDCVYFAERDNAEPTDFRFCAENNCYFEPDDYCSYGERREET